LPYPARLVGALADDPVGPGVDQHDDDGHHQGGDPGFLNAFMVCSLVAGRHVDARPWVDWDDDHSSPWSRTPTQRSSWRRCGRCRWTGHEGSVALSDRK
jgi:hypothetical protein